MSLLTEDTIFTSYQHTEEMGNEPPSVFNDGFEKGPSQTGFFIYSEEPYSLWFNDGNGWTLHQAFSAVNLIKGTTYAWGDNTAAYIETVTDDVLTVHVKPRTGAILIDGNIGDGVNQHDTLVVSGNSTTVNVSPTSIDISAKSINDLDTKLYTSPVSAPGGYDNPVQDSVMFYDEDVTDGNHWKYRTGKSLVIDAVDIDNNSTGKFMKWDNPSNSFLWEIPPMGGAMTSHIIPDANAAYDLGNAEYKIRHLFLSDNSMYIGDTWIKAEGDSVKMPNLLVGDLNLNNTGRQNEVDGTSGHWSIQEGADDLFLINRTTGKKFRFNITEVEEN